MAKRTLPRKEREKLIHKEAILRAATQVFAENGYRNTSMEMIAERAEFATGTLYNFFESKEALFSVLVVDYSNRYYRAVESALDGEGDELRKIRNYLHMKGAFFEKDIKMIKLFFSEGWGLSFDLIPEVSSEIQRQQERFLEKLATVFKNGMEEGCFHRNDSRYLAAAIEGMSNIFLFFWFRYADRYGYLEFLDKMMEIFFNSVTTERYKKEE